MNLVHINQFIKSVRNLAKDTRGANMVEYIIMVGLIAIIAMAGFRFFGSNINQKINQQGQTVNGVTGAEVTGH
jgi:Flp pilus assembly pilin Flp